MQQYFTLLSKHLLRIFYKPDLKTIIKGGNDSEQGHGMMDSSGPGCIGPKFRSSFYDVTYVSDACHFTYY